MGIWSGELFPSLELSDVYPGAAAYCPRASPNACRWLSDDPVLLNSRTGSNLTIAGDLPVLCSRGSSTRDGIELLRAAGFRRPPKVYSFSEPEEYLAQLKVLARDGARLVVLHAHPCDEVSTDSSWVARDLLVFLNNKANLPLLVDAQNAPRRRLSNPATLTRELDDIAVPVVIKVATDESTGGGGDVRLCRVRDDVVRMLADFGDCADLVVEEFLAIARNLCLNFAVMPDASVRYLGSAEQVCDALGIYQGNWIDAASEAPAAAVALGESIAARGAAMGYRGLCGVDVGILDDGRTLAFDLNFRTNGSTCSLLLRDSVTRKTGATVMRLRGWQGTADYRALLDAAYTGLDAGYFVPLASYDPRRDGFTTGTPRLSGLVLGASRDEVRAREAELAALGLE